MLLRQAVYKSVEFRLRFVLEQLYGIRIQLSIETYYTKIKAALCTSCRLLPFCLLFINICKSSKYTALYFNALFRFQNLAVVILIYNRHGITGC